MRRLTSTRSFCIAWFALILCLGSSVDVVIDLVFEGPDAAAEEAAASSEPDNAAEHVLMPSLRGDEASVSVTSISVPVFDLPSSGTLLQFLDSGQLEARSTSPPFRRHPVSFNVPLRI
ncbi:MAG: hypothetical protein JSR62_02070 [Nitrospira sp.]|nr:hypothetical protein [Nitrospira sp.]